MSSDPTTTPVSPLVEQQVDSADTTLHNPRRAVVALGSNLGNRLETLQGAVDALEDTPGVRVKAVSAVYETESVGGPEDQPAYLNAVLVLRTTLPPSSLLERAHAVEDAFGRVREVIWRQMRSVLDSWDTGEIGALADLLDRLVADVQQVPYQPLQAPLSAPSG
jgi:2-amino-4-hydroxy-6-hydroxymethyldihydropteridine diphosphokinase